VVIVQHNDIKKIKVRINRNITVCFYLKCEVWTVFFCALIPLFFRSLFLIGKVDNNFTKKKKMRKILGHWRHQRTIFFKIKIDQLFNLGFLSLSFFSYFHHVTLYCFTWQPVPLKLGGRFFSQTILLYQIRL
jgi:hypothetical protein